MQRPPLHLQQQSSCQESVMMFCFNLGSYKITLLHVCMFKCNGEAGMERQPDGIIRMCILGAASPDTPALRPPASQPARTMVALAV